MLQRPTWSSLSRHSHSCRKATKVGQTTIGQAKTVLSTSRILSQATKVRLRCTHVDFLGTANHIAMSDMVIFIAPQPQLQDGYDDGTDDTRANTIDHPDFIAGYRSKAEIYISALIFLERRISKTAYELCTPSLAFPLYTPSLSQPYLRVRAVLLHSSDACPACVGFLQRQLQREKGSHAGRYVTLGTHRKSLYVAM